MKATERGLLLLCCPLGDRSARPLTAGGFQSLCRRVRSFGLGDADPGRALRSGDLIRLGCSATEADQILQLLARANTLERYLEAGWREGIWPLTLRGEDYPVQLREKGGSVPPVFFCAGDRQLLKGPFLGLAGSRQLNAGGERFARRVGELCAAEGYTLVTGGAVGADQAAAEECLARGGRTVVFVPDELLRRAREAGPRCLLLSAGGYDLPFQAARALTRNTYVHKLGEKTLIAQTGYGRGGTWRGAVENLRRGWSELYVHDDGSPGATALIARGATAVRELRSVEGLRPAQDRYF